MLIQQVNDRCLEVVNPNYDELGSNGSLACMQQSSLDPWDKLFLAFPRTPKPKVCTIERNSVE